MQGKPWRTWRGGGGRQALLAKALAGIDVRPLDDRPGRAAGEPLARAAGRHFEIIRA
jgi:hypothetical protein